MHHLILHHYPLSPFSEKIRAMLGYAGLAWQSALTREMPPRPRVATLVGGYRRIPVAQIGADVFCDSRIIATEIARLSGRPELDRNNAPEHIRAFADAVESEAFFSCILVGGTRKLNRKVRASMSTLDLLRFFWDRLNMGRTAKVKGPSLRGARPRVRELLSEVDAKLEEDFLFGATPSYVDFAVYHGLWFVRDLGECTFVTDFERASAWMDRIKALGEGQRSEIDPVDAIEVARGADPRPIAEEALRDPAIGQSVTIAPSDYGQVPTEGTLVGSTSHRWILARETANVGTVHVHFPKEGFELKG